MMNDSPLIETIPPIIANAQNNKIRNFSPLTDAFSKVYFPRVRSTAVRMERPHTHFSPGAAKARKITFFQGKFFKVGAAFGEKNVGGGQKGLCTLLKSTSSGPCTSL